MLVKYCESEHNLAKGCPTLMIGSMQSYADDDPNFYRCDYREGSFLISNDTTLHTELSASEAEAITGGGVIGGGIQINKGASFNMPLQFPNSFIYCLSSCAPNLEVGKRIDPKYNDYFAITSLNIFINSVVRLMKEQINLSDLMIAPEQATLSYLNSLRIEIFDGYVSYNGRHERIQETNRSEIISLIQNPIEWAFRKEQEHNFASEYRIVFPIVDHNGNVIPVRGKKILRLTPELGCSTIQKKA